MFQRDTKSSDKDLEMIHFGSTDLTTSSWRQYSKELASTEHSLFTQSHQVKDISLLTNQINILFKYWKVLRCLRWQAPLEHLLRSILSTTILCILAPVRSESVATTTFTRADRTERASITSFHSIRPDKITTCQARESIMINLLECYLELYKSLLHFRW